MANRLLVPIHLEALYLESDRPAASPVAEFNRLPYLDPERKRDIHPDSANVSESLLSQPFQDINFTLHAGIHLHWALPGALATGTVDPKSGRTVYPRVPDRWLITRKKNKSIEKQWVVESDYLYPEGKGDFSGSITVLHTPAAGDEHQQPYRYLGRDLPWDAWSEEHVKGYPLTAVGWNDYAFAAFYPNCRGVFGFWDPDYAGKLPKAAPFLEYEVLGWYSDAANDFVAAFNATHGTLTGVDFLISMQKEYNWTFGVVQKTDFEKKFTKAPGDALWHDALAAGWIKNLPGDKSASPVTALISPQKSTKAPSANLKNSQTHIKQLFDVAVEAQKPAGLLCYSRLTFKPGAPAAAAPPQATITMGNSGTEALSAYVAGQIAQTANDKQFIEEQLEALHLLGQLKHRKLDVGPKFQEARHAKGFIDKQGGKIWTVLPRSETKMKNTAKFGQKSEATIIDAASFHDPALRQQSTLPEAIAHQLNQVNALQQQYDSAFDDIESMRFQFYADWYKYMLTVYPPPGEKPSPGIDAMKSFIENNSLKSLKAKLASTGRLAFAAGTEAQAYGKPVTEIGDLLSAQGGKGTLSENLASAINTLQTTVSAHNAKLGPSDIVDWPKFIALLKPIAATSPIYEFSGSYDLYLLWGLLSPATQNLIRNFSKDDSAANRQKIIDDINTNIIENLHFSLDPTTHYSWFAQYLNSRTGGNYGDYATFKSLSESGEFEIYWYEQGFLPPAVRKRYQRLGLQEMFATCIAHQPYYVLEQIIGPRYWQPAEPVVLLTGDAVKASERFARHDLGKENGLLSCGVTSQAWITGAKADRATDVSNLTKMQTALDGLTPNPLAIRDWTQPPSHPHRLDWQVEFFPTLAQGNLANGEFQADFISHNYTLPENACEFSQTTTGSGAYAPAAQLFTGSGMLSEHTTIKLRKEIEAYFRQTLAAAGLPHDDVAKQMQSYFTTDKTHKYFIVQIESSHSFGEDVGHTNAGKVIDWMRVNFDLKKLCLKAKRAPHANRETWFDFPKNRAAFRLWLIQNYAADLRQFSTEYAKIEAGKREEWLTENLHNFLLWRQTSLSKLSMEMVYLAAYVKLTDPQTPLYALSQALSGFNEALLMRKQTIQLPPVADPLAFAEYAPFSDQEIYGQLADIFKMAPMPHNAFNPIRAGALRLHQLRLIDTFGLHTDFDCSVVHTTEQLKPPVGPYSAKLPPRLVQPARLGFRWLSANQNDQEMNNHPASSPVCGWILPNNLDSTLAVYDAGGKPLGSLGAADPNVWRPAPGVTPAVTPTSITNTHLKQLIGFLQTQQKVSLTAHASPSYLQNVITAIDNGLATIDPENFAQFQNLSLLMGRPLAVVRARLNLELKGLFAIDQSWHAFTTDMQRGTREDNVFPIVQFPLRLGENQQLNDGLVAYFIEAGGGYEGKMLYAPQSAGPLPIKRPHALMTLDAGHVIWHALNGAPISLTMLLDPRGKVHATTGLLPTKAIDIPPDQFADALRKIEITFLTTPILTDVSTSDIHLPLPEEGGYAWSWVEPGEQLEIKRLATEATFAAPQMLREGWLRLQGNKSESSK